MLQHDPTILHITCCICLAWTLCRSRYCQLYHCHQHHYHHPHHHPHPLLPSPSRTPPPPPLRLLHQPPHLLSYSPSSPLPIPQFAASQIYLAPEVWFMHKRNNVYHNFLGGVRPKLLKREELIYLFLIVICRQIMQVVFGMLGWQCRTAEVKCRCHNRAGCLVPKQVRIWSEALANPQVEGVRAAGRATGVCVKTKIKLRFAASILNKRRPISLCDSNPVISPATAPPSPANHQHCAVPVFPVAPEADLVPGLNAAITLGLLKPVRAAVLSAILHVAAAKTLVTGPHFSTPEVAVTCEFRAERLSRQAVGCGLQQSCVAGVVAAGDLELCSLDGPESWGDHVCVVSGICSLTNSRSSVVPILAVVLHPVLSIVVWEPGHQSPALVACHVAEDLKFKGYYSQLYNRIAVVLAAGPSP